MIRIFGKATQVYLKEPNKNPLVMLVYIRINNFEMYSILEILLAIE
jgi:hypothetical protein